MDKVALIQENATLRSRNEQAEERNRQLWRALRFYADRCHYSTNSDGSVRGVENGDIAREALATAPPDSEPAEGEGALDVSSLLNGFDPVPWYEEQMRRVFSQDKALRVVAGAAVRYALREPRVLAPTDNGIPELDSLCEQYNDGEIDLCALVCRAWNKALAQSEQGRPEGLPELARYSRWSAIHSADEVAKAVHGDYADKLEAMLAAAPQPDTQEGESYD